MLKMLLTVIFVILAIALTVIVLIQEGKSAGTWFYCRYGRYLLG